MKLCAVIPAAGRGSRLGIAVPKVLAPLGEGATVWSRLKSRLKPFVDHIHVVLSPDGLPPFTDMLEKDPDRAFVSTSVQRVPVGMGDAIFGAASAWRRARTILIVWGDQVNVSARTIEASLAAHGGGPSRIGLPVALLERPYVEYRFDAEGRLAAILQSREGDVCGSIGHGDVGTFVLSTEGLEQTWQAYLDSAERGSRTGEVNFLPFLCFLSLRGWTVHRYAVADPTEARGINTPEDLEFFRRAYARATNAPVHPEEGPPGNA